MHLRETRHQIAPGTVDPRRPRGDAQNLGRPETTDAPFIDEHGVMLEHVFGRHRDDVDVDVDDCDDVRVDLGR